MHQFPVGKPSLGMIPSPSLQVYKWCTFCSLLYQGCFTTGPLHCQPSRIGRTVTSFIRLDLSSNMKSILFHSLAVLLLFQTVSLSEGTLCPLLRAAREASSEKTGSYIVVLKEETSHEMYLNIKAQVELLSTDQKLHGYTEKVAKAFTVRLTDFALNIVSKLLTKKVFYRYLNDIAISKLFF